jgi:hypothetical protein
MSKRDEFETVIHVPLGPHPVNATGHDHDVLECESDGTDADIDEVLAARCISL